MPDTHLAGAKTGDHRRTKTRGNAVLYWAHRKPAPLATPCVGSHMQQQEWVSSPLTRKHRVKYRTPPLGKALRLHMWCTVKGAAGRNYEMTIFLGKDVR